MVHEQLCIERDIVAGWEIRVANLKRHKLVPWSELGEAHKRIGSSWLKIVSLHVNVYISKKLDARSFA